MVSGSSPVSILILDDEPGQRDTLESIFEDEGYTVLLAAAGIEALKIIDEHEVDIILLDNKMPRMTGVEFCSIVQKRHPNIILIMITAHIDEESKNNLGIVIMNKPTDINQLIKLCRSSLAARDEFSP